MSFLPPAAPVPFANIIRKLSVNMFKTPTVQPSAMLAVFNWHDEYAISVLKPAITVEINVTAGGAQQPIDAIRSIKIDNTNNPAAVAVQFPDTQDTIVCPPNSILCEPVITNALQAWVSIADADDNVGATSVYFNNYFVPPYLAPQVPQVVPLWKATAEFPPSWNRAGAVLRTPALGDGMAIASGSLNTATPVTLVPAVAGSFSYITSLAIYLIGPNVPGAGTQVASILVKSQGGASANIANPSVVIPGLTTPVSFGRYEMLTMGSLNLRYPADGAITVESGNVNVLGSFEVHAAVTINPT